MMRFRMQWMLFILAFLSLSISISAQQPPILTIAVPSFWQMLFDEAVLTDFENQYGVDVQLVYDAPTPTFPASWDDENIQSWQESLVDYAESADVLFVDNTILSPEVTRAGMLFDLMPLLQVDSRLNPADFYPAIWDAFMWDGNRWALPIAGQTTLVEYIQPAFDDKGLVYPDANWGINEFANAARQLTEYDDAGNVSLPGMLMSPEERTLLFYSLLQQGFSDDGQPDMPQFPAEDLAPLFETWRELESEGVITSDPRAYIERIQEIPLKVGGGGFFAITVAVGDDDGNENEEAVGTFRTSEPIQTMLAPLPNQSGGVSAQGFAVSAGTPDPQLAYELVRYLSERPEVAGLALGAEPARLSYTADEISSDDDGVQVALVGGSERSEADLALIQQTLQTGVSDADLRFGHYLTQVDSMMANGMDAVAALQTVQGDAGRVVQQMMDADLTIIVDTPESVVLGDGEILLKFGLTSFVQPLPNGDRWDTLAQDFALNDPEVGAVEINSGFMQPRQMLSDNDCVYQPTTTGLFDLDTSQLLPLDPLLNADLNYDINGLPPNILAQMQSNGVTYGLPMTLQPELLTYNPRAFADAGIMEPNDGWDMGEFENALILLDAILDDDEYALESISPINTYLLMLMAAQGGRLFNTATEPVTIDFSSPESINAVTAVLDLVKAGLIQYERLGDSDGFDFVAIGGDDFDNIRASNFLGIVEDNTRLASYPNGSQYIPVSLSVGAGFIGVDSAHPEACYRWLSYVANHPYAFTDMPALLSTLDQPEASAAYDANILNLYQQLGEQARQPNAINPIVWNPYIMVWLNRAFDAYVFDDADLEAELLNAEQVTQSYIDCISQPMDGDLTQENMFEQIDTCGQQLLNG